MNAARSIDNEESLRLRERISELGHWFHNYELAKGVWTNADGAGPGPDYPARRWQVVKPWF